VSVRRLPTKSVRWEVCLELGNDPVTGKRVQHRIRTDPATGDALPIKTQKRAKEIEEDEKVKRRRPGYVEPTTTTVAQYLDRWLLETRDTRSPGTHYDWAGIVRTRLAPGIGGVTMADLTALHVQSLWRELAPRYTRATLELTRSVLSRAMKDAVRWRVVEANPVSGTQLPRTCKPPRERLAWTPEQVRALLAHTQDGDWGVLWRFLFDTGVRIGEAVALSWEDVNLDAGWVWIHRTQATDEAGRRVVVERTKTASGQRTLGIDAATVAALKKHRVRQTERRLREGEYWRGGGFVFDRGDGGRLDAESARYHLRRDCAAAGVPYVTPHGVRRSSITIAAARGGSLLAISKRAGHKGIAITANLYALPSEEADRGISELLARSLDDETGEAAAEG
jgi:integrase